MHNARCAFIAGLGMATGKRVVMLQQNQQSQPIDYRDVVLTYDHPRKIHEMLIPALGEVIEQIQTTRFVPTALPITHRFERCPFQGRRCEACGGRRNPVGGSRLCY